MQEHDLLGMLQVVLKSIERRNTNPSETFKAVEPLCRELGLESMVVYFDDEYPERMRQVFSYGETSGFPMSVSKQGDLSLLDTLRSQLGRTPGIVSARLRNHNREVGVFAGRVRDGLDEPDNFGILVHFLSLIAFVEWCRRNCLREREEREVFFAQSLTERLLTRNVPEVKGLRLDFRLIRSLEAGGDFFEFIPNNRGGLFGMIGSSNGRGLRTVLAVTSIMREVHRSHFASNTLSEVLVRVNNFLLRKHRRHQASICLFEIDVGGRRLSLAKAGSLGIVLGDPAEGIKNISASGGMFLGLMENPRIQDEHFDFKPGQELLCVTEDFYSSRRPDVRPQLRWFLQTAENVVRFKDADCPLAKAMVADLESSTPHQPESMLALSVEFLKEN
ncbi:MAG: serine/threonine-protein phosphatase [Planctomycetota bacterium]|jgi:hypothetical protein|nr:serine/threonine-protein phosphatase [Planctomycetota bacterium]